MSDLHISHLPDRGIVRIAGSDARTFLQGIITNNVEKLSDNSALYSAFVTPQGKFLHDFFVIAQGDVLLLDCEGDRADDLVNRLARYRLRANVDISVADPAPVVSAAFGDHSADAFSLSNRPGAARFHGDSIVYVARNSWISGPSDTTRRNALNRRNGVTQGVEASSQISARAF